MKLIKETSQLEWDLIESSLEQDISVEERSVIDEKLKQIPNLDQKIAYVKKTREDIEDSIRRSKIKEFHTHVKEEDFQVKKPKTKTIGLNAFWYSVAAAVVVLFGIFWMIESNNPSEKIFAKNFKPDVGLPLKMGTMSSYRFYEGMLDYKQENYKEAIAKWQDLLEENPENDTLNYFLGVSNLALGNADKSLEYLKNQDRFQSGMFKEEAAFYAALAEIKKGNFEKAKGFLEKKPSTRNTNLLKQLEKQ